MVLQFPIDTQVTPTIRMPLIEIFPITPDIIQTDLIWDGAVIEDINITTITTNIGDITNQISIKTTSMIIDEDINMAAITNNEKIAIVIITMIAIGGDKPVYKISSQSNKTNINFLIFEIKKGLR